MSATEELRRLLDERGIEWSSPELSPRQTRLPYVKFEPWCEGTLKVTMFNLTPEQAIAATLGIDRHPYEQRITGDGSDWGEIMRNAYDDLMANACESCTPEQMEQLANHIRAELDSRAERTCKLDANDVCSSCGACIQRVTHSVYEMGDGFACYPKYCPNCGARVIDGKEGA